MLESREMGRWGAGGAGEAERDKGDIYTHPILNS